MNDVAHGPHVLKKPKNFCPPFELPGNCINKGCLRLSVFYTRVKNLD